MFNCRNSFLFLSKIMRQTLFYLSVGLLAFGIGLIWL